VTDAGFGRTRPSALLTGLPQSQTFCVDLTQAPLITALFLDLVDADDVRGWSMIQAVQAIGAYEATAGLSTSSHHWRKLVGVEFCGVRWTPLSRPSFFAQARSVYP
jgi:hypothetical protein